MLNCIYCGSNGSVRDIWNGQEVPCCIDCASFIKQQEDYQDFARGGLLHARLIGIGGSVCRDQARAVIKRHKDVINDIWNAAR